jgi:hypothetical protein
MAKAHQLATTDALEHGVDEAIAACDGDARAAVRALLVIIELLEREQETLATMVSNGYARGRIAARKGSSRTH